MQEGHYCEHGKDAYSYATCLRTTDERNVWIYNVTQYSTTTSRHQSKAFGHDVSALRKLKQNGTRHNGHAVLLDGVPRNASAQDLRSLAERLMRGAV